MDDPSCVYEGFVCCVTSEGLQTLQRCGFVCVCVLQYGDRVYHRYMSSFKSNEAKSRNSVLIRARVRLSVASLFTFILKETTFRILDTLNACMILPAKERGCGSLLISIVFLGEQH